jgi:uncharacterized surface protein with fasciclin (FAS1) repeats
MRNCNRLIIIFLNLFMVIASFTSCKKSSFGDNPPSRVSLYQIMVDDKNYSLFKAAIDRAGLKAMFEGDKQLTVLVPRNEAMSVSGLGSVAAINNYRPSFMDSLVKNHIISGRFDVKTISGTKEIQTLNKSVIMTRIGDQVYCNGMDILNYNKQASNGLLNVTYRILGSPVISMYDWAAIPAVANNATNTTFLVAAIDRASQGTTDFKTLLKASNTTGYTLFAPSNQAFIDAGYANIAAVTAATPASLTTLLNNHMFNGRKFTSDFDSIPLINRAGLPIYFDRRVINGGLFLYTANYADGILLNPSNLTATSGAVALSNVLTENGVIHLVSRLMPTPITNNTLQQINTDANLTFLKAAIVRANEGTGERFDFAALLSNPNQSYTVFAPNNAAFIAAGYATTAAVSAASPKVLIDLLKYHIVRYRQNSINFIANSSIPTILELPNLTTGISALAPIVITARTNTSYTLWGEGDIAVATVVPTSKDIITTNGLINIIDKLLTPRKL